MGRDDDDIKKSVDAALQRATQHLDVAMDALSRGDEEEVLATTTRCLRELQFANLIVAKPDGKLQ